MYFAYSVLLGLGLVIMLPYWLFRMRRGKYTDGLSERLGKVPTRLGRQDQRPAIWIHAVSVGEVLAVKELILAMRSPFPDHRIFVSTTTNTGQRLARQHFGEENVFYFPLDFAFAVRPYLDRLRPQLVVLAETEFWPNFLRLAHRYGAQ